MITSGKASSFADPADKRAFDRCKLEGKSDEECFKVGDNCIGKWGDATDTPIPVCALPPEQWEQFGHFARGKLVRVWANNKTVVCELRDTLPHEKFIKHGVVIDLNPAACSALGLTPPVLISASWDWA